MFTKYLEFLTESTTLKSIYRTDPLYGLKQHAKYYTDFNKFSHDYSIDLLRGIYWHITSEPNFEIRQDVGSRDMSSISDDSVELGSFMVTGDLESWDDYYNGENEDNEGDGNIVRVSRPYVAQIDLSAINPLTINVVNRGFGHEIYLPPQKSKLAVVVGTYSRKVALSLSRKYDKVMPQSEQELKDLWLSVH